MHVIGLSLSLEIPLLLEQRKKGGLTAVNPTMLMGKSRSMLRMYCLLLGSQ